MKLYPDNNKFKAGEEEVGARQDEIDRDIDIRNEMKRRAILKTTAVLQGAAKNRGDLSILTAIGAIVGSSFNKSI